MSNIGFSLTRTELLELVKVYLNGTNQSHLFKNGAPTKTCTILSLNATFKLCPPENQIICHVIELNQQIQ